MTRALGRDLTEFNYLTQSDDRTRQGILRFLDDNSQSLSRLSSPVPRLVELEQLGSGRVSSISSEMMQEKMASQMANVVNGIGRKSLRLEEESASEISSFTAMSQHDAMERALAL